MDRKEGKCQSCFPELGEKNMLTWGCTKHQNIRRNVFSFKSYSIRVRIHAFLVTFYTTYSPQFDLAEHKKDDSSRF